MYLRCSPKKLPEQPSATSIYNIRGNAVELLELPLSKRNELSRESHNVRGNVQVRLDDKNKFSVYSYSNLFCTEEFLPILKPPRRNIIMTYQKVYFYPSSNSMSSSPRRNIIMTYQKVYVVSPFTFSARITT